MVKSYSVNDALDLLSRATFDPVTTGKLTQWLATAGRDSLETMDQNPQSLNTLKGLVEAVIVLAKLVRLQLGDETEQGYSQDQMLQRLLEIGTSYRCTSEIIWAAQRAIRGADIQPG
jgi:hypothetical protein